jgi:hypothetical protein
MKRPLDLKFIVVATSAGVLLLLAGYAGRALYLRTTGIKGARAHANAAFQGEPVKTYISSVGFWRQELAGGKDFRVYMESSNGWGIEPADWTYIAVKTSDNKRYERVERFEYAEARAYGDAATEFMPMWKYAKSPEERAEAVQERCRAWSEHPRVAQILRLRLVSSLGELGSTLADLGFTER